MLHVVEDGVEAFALLGAVARDQVGVARVLLVVQVAAEDLEFFREGGLRTLLEVDWKRELALAAGFVAVGGWPARQRLVAAAQNTFRNPSSPFDQLTIRGEQLARAWRASPCPEVRS